VSVFLNADLFAVYKRLATSEVQQQRVLNAAQSIEARYAAQIANAANNPATVQELQSQLSNDLNAASMSYPALGIVPFQSWAEFRNALTTGWTIIGWLVMASLLSLGAPFWHDTLESLFGLKNFLRDKTNTNKVEQQSGDGITTT
jgi:hypothetical protein